MRATMAIPGVFTPVTVGDRLLVDGGTLDNIPADVVRAMGADIVIAVDVSADFDDDEADEQSSSIFEVLGRTIDAMMYAGIRTSLKEVDLMLDPDLSKLSATDWRKSDELADRGHDAAEAKAETLRRYALDQAAWTAFVEARTARMRDRQPAIDAIEVVGADADDTKVIRQAIEIPPGQRVDVDALELALAHLTGNDRYDTVSYRVEQRDTKNVLVLDVVPKAYAPPFLHISFDLQNLDSTNFSANGRVRVTFLDLLNAGSELRADVSVGSNQLAGAELFVPLGNSKLIARRAASRVFVAPRVAFSRTRRNGFVDDQLVAEYRVKRTGAGLDLGFTSGRRSELRVGYDIADVRANLRVGLPMLPEARGTERYASLRYTFDGWTSPLVPTRGLLARGAVRRYFSSARPTIPTFQGTPVAHVDEFWQAEASLTQFFRVRAADRVLVSVSGGSSFGEESMVYNFRLGGPFRIGSKNLDEVTGPNYALGIAGYLRQIGRLPDFLGSSILAGAWVETGTAFAAFDSARIFTSVSTGIIIETFLGPMYGGLSTGSGGGVKVYVALGPIFR
jgi:NTE family protein